jgi:prepilin-type N-terminal cleavage/methylation domain-containing protein
MKKRFGFTLAEVLITLGIIGVVAAMTIPTLMTNTTASQFKTAYKKSLSNLKQAILSVLFL